MALSKWLTQLIVAAARQHVDGEGPVYSDEHIERCATLYLDNPIIRARGVLFTMFVAYPEEIMLAVVGGTAIPLPAGEEYYPLLEQQRVVRDRLQEDEDQAREVHAQISELDRLLNRRRGMRVSNGAAIEPMHHKRFGRAKSYPPLIEMDMGS